jgi:RNA polymerase sigma-32 factor
MNRRLLGDVSLNAPIREDYDAGEWQDWLVDDTAGQQEILVAGQEAEARRQALAASLSVLNDRERRIFEARRLAERPNTRVRQIEVRAFEKVQKAVQERVATLERPALGPRS